MASLLPQLDVNARLLMYLAGELPAEDATVMATLLAVDADLRGQLDELCQLQDQFGAMVGATESVETDEASVQRTMRAIRQRNLELAARPMVLQMPRQSQRRRQVFQYSLVAAAASVALFIGLWGLGMFAGPTKPAGMDMQVRELGYDGVDPNLVVRDDASKRLDEAAEQIRSLRSNDEDDGLLLML